MKGDKHIGLTVPVSLLKKVERRRKQTGQSRSAFIRSAIKQYLKGDK